MENFYADQIKVDCRSSSSKSLIEFYINFEEYLVRLKELISTLEKKVLDPVALFKSQISSIYLESLNDFKSLVTQTQDNKKNIEKQKGKFYDSCKAVLEKEHEFMTSYTKQSKSSDYDIKIANDVLLKYKSIAENNCEIYKYEIQKFNQTIDENELQYKKLIGVLKSNEESRIFFLKCHVEKFSKIFEEYIIGGFNFINVFTLILENQRVNLTDRHFRRYKDIQ